MAHSPWRQTRWTRPRLGIVAGLAIAALIAIGSVVLAPPPAQMVGHAVAVDGDTLRIGGTRIRLLGLDAPELDQSCTDAAGAQWDCGAQAKGFMIGLVEHRTLTCVSSRRDGYGRALATCDAGQGDIGAQIVASGWAVADLSYGPQAASAQASKLGIWSGSFTAPAEWRRSHDGVGISGLWDWIASWFHS